MRGGRAALRKGGSLVLSVRALLGLERFDEARSGRVLRLLMPTNWPAGPVRVVYCGEPAVRA